MPRTPGPWEYHRVMSGDCRPCYLIGGPGYAAVVADEIHSEADARLVAAAPDLLEACRRLAALRDLVAGWWVRSSDKAHLLAALEDAAAAARRAEGE